jgi:UDP-N-acetylmuramate dehydrogenase
MQILENYSLKTHNTFGIEEKCLFFIHIFQLEELPKALAFAQEKEIPWMILGGGSNILLTKTFDGLVIKMGHTGIKLLEETDTEVKIRVGAGENWHALVLHCLQKSWFGLENLSLIPGSVGAAPMQNIGAYGVEVKQFIERVHFWDVEKGSLHTLNNQACAFGYRESTFKHEWKGKAIIWEVDFVLKKNAQAKTEYGDIQKTLESWGIQNPQPEDVSRAVIHIRQSKLPDPAQIGNAGSFFKNPVVDLSVYEKIKVQYPQAPSYPAGPGQVKMPAGWLIETAGWKGKRIENYGVHEKQALVLVNYGGTKGEKILALSQSIQADVVQKFGIYLQAEVNLI